MEKFQKARSFKTETSPKIPQILTKLNLSFFLIPKFFNTESETIKKMEKFRKPRSFETETSHSDPDNPVTFN